MALACSGPPKRRWLTTTTISRVNTVARSAAVWSMAAWRVPGAIIRGMMRGRRLPIRVGRRTAVARSLRMPAITLVATIMPVATIEVAMMRALSTLEAPTLEMPTTELDLTMADRTAAAALMMVGEGSTTVAGVWRRRWWRRVLMVRLGAKTCLGCAMRARGQLFCWANRNGGRGFL